MACSWRVWQPPGYSRRACRMRGARGKRSQVLSVYEKIGSLPFLHKVGQPLPVRQRKQTSVISDCQVFRFPARIQYLARVKKAQ